MAQGKGQGVEVRLVSPRLQDTEPGRILSFSFHITNYSGAQQEFQERLELPDGWQAIIPLATFVLRDGESITRLVALQVPPDARAGRYDVTYGVRGLRDYGLQDADTASVAVLPVTKLALLIEDKPERVIAGERIEAKLRLVNQGNNELKVALEVSSQENYPAQIEPAEVSVPAGGSVPLTLTVETDPKESRLRTLVIGVKARALEAEEGVGTAAATVTVEIIPRVTGELDIYHRLPVDLTLRLAGEEGNLRAQVALEGKGTLDEEGTRHVEFLLQAPDMDDAGPFSEPDLYRLRYRDPRVGLRLGDQNYELSRLTSSWSYGRGVGIDYHPPEQRGSVGGYFLNTRWGTPEREELGLYAGYRVNDKVSARLNFLREEEDASRDRPATHDTIVSLEAVAHPTRDMNLEAEYATCDSDGRGGSEDNAYRVSLNGRPRQKLYYDFYLIHGDPDYYGSYWDTEYLYGTVSFPLAQRTQGHVSYRKWERNLDLRADRRYAPRERQWDLGINRDIGHGWYLSLAYDDLRRYELLPPADYDYDEQGITLGVGRTRDKYSFRFEARTADQEDRLAGLSRRGWNYEIFGTYRPSAKNYFTLHVGFGDDEALQGSYLLRESSNLEFMSSWQLRPDMDLNFWYTKYNFDGGDYRPESDSYNLRLRYELPNTHQLILEARHNTCDWWEDETSYMLAYTIPLGLPVAKKKNIGSIRGRVYDAEAPGQPGLPGVILRTNGATAVTNAKGEFIFPSAVPGTYQISVDRTSIGLERTTEQKMPLTVEVVGGESTEVDLGVVRAAQLSGKVLVMPANGNGNGNNGNGGNGNGNGANGNGNGAVVIGEPGNNKGRREPTGLANVLVELANGQEILRRITDQKGEFLFDSIRPGSWHLKVYDHNLPAYHYLETPEQDLTLEPGARAEITVRILPKVRQIKFIDEGVIQPNGNNH